MMPATVTSSSATRRTRTLGQALDEFRGVGPGFNTLRLGAAVAVLVSHAFDLAPSASAPEPMRHFSGGQSSLGGTAVYIFFMISGFLVTASYFRSRSASEYVRKRASRILPALLVVVLVTSCVLGPLLTPRPLAQYFSDEAFRAFLWNILFVGDPSLPGVFEQLPAPGIVNGSLWTLRYEVICYVLLAVVCSVGLCRHQRLFLAALVPLLVLGWWAKGQHLYTFAPLGIEFPYILRFLAYFAAGMALYVFKDHIILDSKLAIAALVLSIIFLRFGMYHLFFPLLGGYLVAFLGMQKSLDLAVIRERDYSYGFYLYAFPVQQLVIAAAPSYAVWWTNILFSVPLTLILAMLSWHVVEKPALPLVRGTGTPTKLTVQPIPVLPRDVDARQT
jgi:peptidoglycan/LPS O-acetylase OafA/YrhL